MYLIGIKKSGTLSRFFVFAWGWNYGTIVQSPITLPLNDLVLGRLFQ